MSRMYRLFPLFPEALMAPPAFVTELMGLTVYQHVDRRPGRRSSPTSPRPVTGSATLLREIMTDELAHVGQRRNFLGPVGLRAAR